MNILVIAIRLSSKILSFQVLFLSNFVFILFFVILPKGPPGRDQLAPAPAFRQVTGKV